VPEAASEAGWPGVCKRSASVGSSATRREGGQALLSPPFTVPVDDVKSRVLHSMTVEQDFWASGGTLRSLRSRIEKATREIIGVLRRLGGYPPPPPEE
jgi:hypothetical protein